MPMSLKFCLNKCMHYYPPYPVRWRCSNYCLTLSVLCQIIFWFMSAHMIVCSQVLTCTMMLVWRSEDSTGCQSSLSAIVGISLLFFTAVYSWLAGPGTSEDFLIPTSHIVSGALTHPLPYLPLRRF